MLTTGDVIRYEPTEGKLINDINAAWGTVDAADVENKAGGNAQPTMMGALGDSADVVPDLSSAPSNHCVSSRDGKHAIQLGHAY